MVYIYEPSLFTYIVENSAKTKSAARQRSELEKQRPIFELKEKHAY